MHINRTILANSTVAEDSPDGMLVEVTNPKYALSSILIGVEVISIISDDNFIEFFGKDLDGGFHSLHRSQLSVGSGANPSVIFKPIRFNQLPAGWSLCFALDGLAIGDNLSEVSCNISVDWDIRQVALPSVSNE